MVVRSEGRISALHKLTRANPVLTSLFSGREENQGTKKYFTT